MTTEKEALAVYWGIKHFHPYLHGRHFRLVVDHNAIQWLQECKDKVPKLIRWSMKIDSYSFTIEYKRGKLHTNADALSRMPIQLSLTTNIVDEWRAAQRADPKLAEIINYLETKQEPRANPKPPWWAERDNFTTNERLLFRIFHERPNSPSRELKFQLAVPTNKIQDILEENHDHMFGGHLGIEKTYYKIRDRYFWEGMYTAVKVYCARCDICNRRTQRGGAIAPMGKYQIPLAPFQRVHIDVLDPFPTTEQGLSSSNPTYSPINVSEFHPIPSQLPIKNLFTLPPISLINATFNGDKVMSIREIISKDNPVYQHNHAQIYFFSSAFSVYRHYIYSRVSSLYI
jgi:hypothetical protein